MDASSSTATRSRRWGLLLQQVGSDLSSMVGGNFVNRFNIDGRAYKVIPQIERSGRLTSDQLQKIYISGPGASSWAAQRGRHPSPGSSRGPSIGSSSSTR